MTSDFHRCDVIVIAEGAAGDGRAGVPEGADLAPWTAGMAWQDAVVAAKAIGKRA